MLIVKELEQNFLENQRESSEIVICADGVEEFRGTLKELVAMLNKK